MIPMAYGSAAVSIAFEPETVTLLAALTGTYDAGRQSAINAFIKALKNNGTWAKRDQLCIAGLNVTDSLINWKSPGTLNASLVNSPSFVADRGFTGNGSSSYINTNFNPSTAAGGYTLNSAHLAVYSRSNIAQASSDIGADEGSNQAVIAPQFTDANYYVAANQGSPSSAASPGSSGFLLVSRTSSSAAAYYRNGNSVGAISIISSAVPNSNFFVCRRSSATFPQYSTREIAAWSLGSGLTSSEVSADSTALNTYLTYIGAAV